MEHVFGVPKLPVHAKCELSFPFPFLKLVPTMKNYLFRTACAAVAVVSSAASADVVMSFTGLSLYGKQFTEAIKPGQIVGTLTGATINVSMTQSFWFTKANDLTLYMDIAPLSNGGLLQIGGELNAGALERHSWLTGGSIFSTTSTGRVDLNSHIDLASHPTVSFWVGNGRDSFIASGTWSGSIVLHGVNLAPVPAPGAVALIGLAALVSRRRR